MATAVIILIAVLPLLVPLTFGQKVQATFYFSAVADRMPENAARRSTRPQDPSGLVPHLYQGDVITVDICVKGSIQIMIENITHSNDGAPDDILVSLDGRKIGNFQTIDHSNWGQMWDYFNGSRALGSPTDLSGGTHKLTFTVMSSDCYGLELGTLYITANRSIDANLFWCDNFFTFSDIRPECSSVIPHQPIKTPAPTTSPETPVSSSNSTASGSTLSTTPLINNSTTTAKLPTTTTPTTPTSTITLTSSTVTQTTPPTTQSSTTASTKAAPLPQTTRLQNVFLTSRKVFKTTSFAPDYDGVVVTQRSFKTECLDSINVRVEFSVPSLTGVRILSRTENTPYSQKFIEREKTSGATTCEDTMWQLGKMDGKNEEFQAAPPTSNVNISISQSNERLFPGLVHPPVTQVIDLLFGLPKGQTKQPASAYVAVGLVNVTEAFRLGLQYHDRKTQSLSDIHYVTFTPRQPVMGWNLPNLGAYEGDKSAIRLHFDPEIPDVAFDFLRMDFSAIDVRKKNILLDSENTLRVRGLQLSTGSGMNVSINGKHRGERIEKIQILYRQGIWQKYHNILSIHSNGRLFPYHRNMIRDTENGNSKVMTFVDVSGFIVSRYPTKESPIEHVNIETFKQRMTLTFVDKSKLSFQMIPTDTDTQLYLIDFHYPGSLNESFETSPPRQTITFTSTHVTDYLAAVNEMVVDGLYELPVMSDLGAYSGKDLYTFRKTSPTKLFHASQVLEIMFLV